MQEPNTAVGDLPTEAQNPHTLDLDALSSLDFVKVMQAADLEAVIAVEKELASIAATIDVLTIRLRAGGRLFYLGAGTSGRLGVLDAAECPPTFNSPAELIQGVIAGGERALRYPVEGAEDDPLQAREDLAERGFSSLDSLVGIAASGRTPYVLGGIAYARELGALSIGLSCVPGSALATAPEFAIVLNTAAEVVTGSTRMKAGTATKLVLNMLSTGVMVKLGYVYGNLMVNLQPTNGKLIDRATRIIEKLTGLPRNQATELLAEGGSVPVAVIMHRLHLDRRAASQRLKEADGRLREALG